MDLNAQPEQITLVCPIDQHEQALDLARYRHVCRHTVFTRCPCLPDFSQDPEKSQARCYSLAL